jgi:heat shock protein HslJ
MKRTFIMMTAVLIFILTIFAGCGGVSPLENVRWVLISYSEPGSTKTVLPDTEVTARFDSETKEVRGNGGCNTYFGGYKVDGDELMMTGPFAVTEMWCGDEVGQQESDYLGILLAADGYRVFGDALVVYSGDNLLNFERE